jgi:1-phosphatidylinositol phosphodiesterase
MASAAVTIGEFMAFELAYTVFAAELRHRQQIILRRTAMSYGFLVEFVNNTASPLALSATIGSEGDWESATQSNPAVDLKGCVLAPFSSKAFHEERHNYRASAPFTVTADFGDGKPAVFMLDGCDAENLANNREIPTLGNPVDHAVFQVTSPSSETGGQYYKMTLFITPRVSPTRWMGHLLQRKPDATLTEITIPGTHESGTAGGNGEMGTRCQNLSIGDQLALGVRFFDLRVRPYEDMKDLGIFHYTYTQNLWLGQQVLPELAQFLADHPDECVILMFNRAVEGDAAYDTLLHDLLCGNAARGIPIRLAPDTVYDRDDASALKLKDLRGCVVIMRRDLEASFGLKVFGLPDDDADAKLTVGGMTMRVQDAYEYSQVSGSSIAAAKWPNVKHMLDKAKHDPSTWCLNFSSASHSPPTLNAYPWDIATGNSGVNMRLARYLVTTEPGRVGCVLMDYANEPGNGMLCQLLIAQNERP